MQSIRAGKLQPTGAEAAGHVTAPVSGPRGTGFCCSARPIFPFTPGSTPTFRMGLPASVNPNLETPSATCTCEVCPLRDFISVKLTKIINPSGMLLMETLKAFDLPVSRDTVMPLIPICFITELPFN